MPLKLKQNPYTKLSSMTYILNSVRSTQYLVSLGQIPLSSQAYLKGPFDRLGLKQWHQMLLWLQAHPSKENISWHPWIQTGLRQQNAPRLVQYTCSGKSLVISRNVKINIDINNCIMLVLRWSGSHPSSYRWARQQSCTWILLSDWPPGVWPISQQPSPLPR